MKKILYKGICLFTGLICSSVVVADMSVNSKTWPKQLPNGEYEKSSYYGNGNAGSFRKAMQGNNIVTDAEQIELEAMLPESEIERWYLKIGMHKATTKINSVTNKSTSTTLSPFALSSAKASKDITSWQIGAGYAWNSYRADVDYISNSSIDYNQAPLFTLASGAGWPNMTSSVTGQHLIANAYYDFDEMFLFRPFVGISVGVGMNKASAIFSNGGAYVTDGAGLSKSTFCFDYGAQIGTRMKVYKRFHVSASYRYLNLGSIKWQDSSNNLMLKGKRSFNGFSLDLIYLI